MKEFFKYAFEPFIDFKEHCSDVGFFVCLFHFFIYYFSVLFVFILVLPFLPFIYLNDVSKSWFRGDENAK